MFKGTKINRVMFSLERLEGPVKSRLSVKYRAVEKGKFF